MATSSSSSCPPASRPAQSQTSQPLQPSAEHLTDVGTRLKNAGDLRGALDHYYEALRVDPTLYAAQYNLGVVCLEAGDLERAREHTEQAYKIDPRRVDAMNNLGAIHRAQGNHEAAVEWFKAACHLNPNCPAMQNNLALALVTLGLHRKPTDPKGAIRCYQESLVCAPQNATTYYNLGVSYDEMRKHDKALINYNLCVHFNPRCAEAYNNMGVIYKERDNLEKALMCYHTALQCNPQFAQALNNLGMVYTATGRLHEALDYLSRAVKAAPTYAEAYNNLGWLFWDQGDLGQALRMYECCIELSPTSKNPGQNRLLALNYLPDASAASVFEAHRAWGERFSLDQGVAFTEWPVDRDPSRRLRLAYMSPDFFHHSVSFFAHALIEHRSQEQFDVFLYSNTAREDDKTEFFKKIVTENRWKKIVGRSAQEVATMLREDKIDILIELAGHTANNRLDVVALKPCPVQITYTGYNNTTGLGAVDYRITDAVVDPPDTAQEFSEELIRLPSCFLCYTPPANLPNVEKLPALREGFVTFGSFSCLAKINAQVVDLWCRVLREVPNSKLLIKAKGFYAQGVQARFTKMFEKHGIEASRLRLVALTATSFDHLKTYNEVDIALDTFPYSNTTTTCESLVMGVPPLCMNGKTHGSRVGASLLATVGLNEFVAETQDEYVEKAKIFAGNLQQLSSVREKLRNVLSQSQLCNGPKFMRESYEPALREKWRLFCQGRAPSTQKYASMEPPHPLAPGAFAPPLAAGVDPITGQAFSATPSLAQMLAATPMQPSTCAPQSTSLLPNRSLGMPQALNSSRTQASNEAIPFWPPVGMNSCDPVFASQQRSFFTGYQHAPTASFAA